jgi:hypothetical protein
MVCLAFLFNLLISAHHDSGDVLTHQTRIWSIAARNSWSSWQAEWVFNNNRNVSSASLPRGLTRVPIEESFRGLTHVRIIFVDAYMVEDLRMKENGLESITWVIFHFFDHRIIIDRAIGHCIDYLRQVLMCHGENRIPHILPDFRIRHTCRNFDSIWNFAAKRNTSGIGIEWIDSIRGHCIV